MKNTIRPLTIVMLGLQGSGKGTQAQFLADKYGFQLLDMGSSIRDRVNQGQIPAEDKKLTQEGKLIRDETTITIANEVLDSIDSDVSLIIDGYPRTLAQANALLDSFEKISRSNNYKVIDLQISKEIAIERASSRLMCKKCGKILSVKDNNCTCGGELERRKDDEPSIIENRIKFVSGHLNDIKLFFRERGVLIEIDGQRSRDAIFSDLEGRLNLK